MGSPRPSRQLQPHRLPGREVTDADKVYKAAAKKAKKAGAAPSADDAQREQWESNRDLVARARAPIQQISNSNSGSRMRLSMHKITLVSLDVLEAYIQNAGLTGSDVTG